MAAAASGTTPILFQDQFEVKDLSRKFEKVTRYSCRLSDEGYDMSLEMDINSDIFPLELNDRFTLALASTLALDGKPDTGVYDQSGIPSLADQYDYVMYGKLYKWKQEQPKAPIEVQVSFGGLLMRLIGDSHHLEKLHLDSRVYLLIRKINQGGADIDMS
ncbi:RNA polymerase ii core subunit [Chrysochromulina tobinii]|jgi:DNA-directed RNA polymerase I, II, and III subunit RPABC3|uniref:DNA-directed RNA polymerases I, II, and III subunit RPABC3 n=1 Tax=Chrysochromulina tobinii TaxID=1460289 RepID=A0A0M0JY93_9EUKA|nr:RNA polymerase ii core subunit [Chrysochromulina tobinii]|eukprot:KOO31287.1 RNA polymerase ii core subunit [Chrysochromulina sp. CCMP291]